LEADDEVYHLDENKTNDKISNLGVRKYAVMPHGVRIWTEEETELLVKNSHLSYDKLAQLIGRTARGIRNKVGQMHLNKPLTKKRWTAEDDEQLKQLYSNLKLSVKEISQIMGKGEGSVRLRANRTLDMHRSDRHLRPLNEKCFYMACKKGLANGSVVSQCCLCEYSKYVQLHHIRDRKNDHVSNIATLCPTHHVEVGHGEHKDKKLYATWRRRFSDGSLGDVCTNLDTVVSQPVSSSSQ
jgi:hypothetical protein